MSSSRGIPSSEWLARAITGVLVVGGFVLAIAASDSPQCCDAIAYQEEAHSIVARQAQLLPVHNYGYAAFLALLEMAGISDRSGIAVAQATLLYAAVLAAAIVIGRVTRSSASVAAAWLAAVALLPAAAWSGLTLSEGLAVPVLISVLAVLIATIARLMRGGQGLALVLAMGVLSGMAWMVRPSLVWVPVTIGLMLVVISLYLAFKGRRVALLLPVGFAVAVALAAAPQLRFGSPLKLDLADLQAMLGRQIFRYATDMSRPEPAPMPFSPLPPEALSDPVAAAARTQGSREWQVTAMAAHVVSGWDARPTPAYLYPDTGDRWVIPSALSGFPIMGVICVALMLWQRRRRWNEAETALLAALVLVFAVSQATLALTQAEFRFNAPGWLTAGFCLAMLSAFGWWTRRRLGGFVVLALVVSGGVLLIGQMTLLYSERWLEYSGLTG